MYIYIYISQIGKLIIKFSIRFKIIHVLEFSDINKIYYYFYINSLLWWQNALFFINYLLQVLVNNSTVNTINYFEVSNLPLLSNKKHIENIKIYIL